MTQSERKEYVDQKARDIFFSRIMLSGLGPTLSYRTVVQWFRERGLLDDTVTLNNLYASIRRQQLRTTGSKSC